MFTDYCEFIFILPTVMIRMSLAMHLCQSKWALLKDVNNVHSAHDVDGGNSY